MKTKLAVLALLGLAASAYAQNLVSNGTFNTDTTGYSTPSGWTLVSGDSYINPAGYLGSFPTQALDLGTGNPSTLQTNVNLTNGQLYQLTFDSYNYGGFSGASHNFTVNGNTFAVNIGASGVIINNSYYFTASATGATALKLSTTSPFADTNNWVDNISVKAVPEPSAALLGGIGVLGLFIRRRK